MKINIMLNYCQALILSRGGALLIDPTETRSRKTGVDIIFGSELATPSNLRGEKGPVSLAKDQLCRLLRSQISIPCGEAAGVFEVALEVADAGDTVQATTRPLKRTTTMSRMLRQRIRLFRIRIMMPVYPDSAQSIWGIWTTLLREV